MFVSNRAPLNYGCGFVWFLYTKTDQVNVSIYIKECKGVPSTHQTGTVTVVNLRVLRQTDLCGMAYLHMPNRKLPNRDH